MLSADSAYVSVVYPLFRMAQKTPCSLEFGKGKSPKKEEFRSFTDFSRIWVAQKHGETMPIRTLIDETMRVIPILNVINQHVFAQH